MVDTWVPLPLDKPLFKNLVEGAVVGHQTAIENGYINELGGHTRFPGLVERVSFGNNARVQALFDWNGDLVAASDEGQIYKIDRNFNATNVTGVPLEGGRRPIFAKTDKDLLVAAGGPILRLRSMQTELLSVDAPESTHVAWVDNFTLAIEINSGRFFHSGAGAPDQWDPLDVFATDGNPDNISALLITPFREVEMFGESSVEQFERLPTGDVPFFRRWAISDGLKAPYLLMFADNATWLINAMTEFVRQSGQSSEGRSAEIGKYLEAIDDWTDAWMGGYPIQPLHISGQKFIVIQAPNATNPYGTKGITLVYDYRAKRFFELYGWDDAVAAPVRWPGWCHWRVWDRVFVGGTGRIYEMVDTVHVNGTQRQRWLVRTSHIAQGEGVQVKNLRLQLRRGAGGSVAKIRVRCSRNTKPFGPWIERTLGAPGESNQFIQFGSFGNAQTFQWEIASTDDAPIDLVKAEIKAEPLGH